ncbi:MAG: PEP-CTERM sorting domain-containing protein [Pirellulales bacterium]|nr:PEP-CTERM sorting domain-containing protein [Pirellulales bacterium]
MKRSSRSLLALVVVLAAGFGFCLAAAANAQDFERSTHYRFLPRHSVLNETGGIFPRDIDYRVFGEFDFERRALATVWPPQYLYKFDDVDAWASHPILAYVLPLNQVLNLEGLTGRQLPVASPYDVFKFEGKTQDGSSVDLYATQIGPWLRLRGATTPPPGSADFFEYKLSAVARQTPFADFNENDAVDAGDLTKWTGGFGSTPSGSNGPQPGDSNGDQLVDGTDFLTWQRQLGETPPIAALDAAMDAALASLTVTAAAMPEPGSLAMLGVGVALIAAVRRR